MSERDCTHGQLARSCGLCERDATIAEQARVIAMLREHKNEYMDAAEVTKNALLTELATLKQPISDEREAFEAHAKTEWPTLPLHRRDALPVEDPRYGEYVHLQHEWITWQARARLGNAVVMPEQWSKSFQECWPVDRDDAEGDWAVGSVMRDGDEIYYPVIVVEAAQYDAPGESEKIARALVSLLNPACAVARLNPSRGVPAVSRESCVIALRLVHRELETLANGSAIERFKAARAEFAGCLAAAPTPAPTVEGDGMCNADNPAARCVCREELGYRVCKPTVEPAHSDQLQIGECACGRTDPHNNTFACIKAASDEYHSADVSVPRELHDEAEHCAIVLESIAAMDAEEITGDDIDLRFEDSEGRDTGCDVSIVEYADRAAKLLRALLAGGAN